jgi:hypothetical protein
MLEACDFPLSRLARDLGIAAAVLEEALERDGSLAETLKGGARFVRSRRAGTGAQ